MIITQEMRERAQAEAARLYGLVTIGATQGGEGAAGLLSLADEYQAIADGRGTWSSETLATLRHAPRAMVDGQPVSLAPLGGVVDGLASSPEERRMLWVEVARILTAPPQELTDEERAASEALRAKLGADVRGVLAASGISGVGQP